MVRPARLLPLLTLALAACSSPRLTVYAAPDMLPVVEGFLVPLGVRGLRIVESPQPATALTAGGAGVQVAIVADAPCDECYQIDDGPTGYVVHGGGVLGVQYGLAAMLEELGFRFYHPARTLVPDRIAPVHGPQFGQLHRPEQQRRGLHLHTLHPIEGYFDFWERSEGNLERARRVVNWVIANRGNYLQWVALGDIATGAPADWTAHTRAILDYAHARGMKVGVGIQLFSQANLQLGFDLISGSDPARFREQIASRLHVLLDGMPFDVVDLSFGEFKGADPHLFVDTVNLVYEVLQEIAPGTEMAATVHVGNYPDLRVSYEGEELLYYFLVKFANPAIVPWVHTVMYYNLFEDAGGAYLHDEFDEHRAFLLERLAAGLPAAYFPESAYWVAFDNSVPTYLPLYVRSRWLDMSLLRAAGADLRQHVLFSSGWEWGYWQHDYATLRMGYKLPETWEEIFGEMFAPLGSDGQSLAQVVVELATLQHEALIEKRLAAYLAGRDVFIDAGDPAGIVSQPDRPSFAEVAAFDAAGRAAFTAQVLDGLGTLAAGMAGLLERGAALSMRDPWIAEVRDGLEVTLARTRFIASLYRAAVAFGEGGPTAEHLAAADEALEAGRTVVRRRHASLHDPVPERLLEPAANSTIYHYGYLLQADTLCYWERERVEVRNLVLGENVDVPPCFQL